MKHGFHESLLIISLPNFGSKAMGGWVSILISSGIFFLLHSGPCNSVIYWRFLIIQYRLFSHCSNSLFKGFIPIIPPWSLINRFIITSIGIPLSLILLILLSIEKWNFLPLYVRRTRSQVQWSPTQSSI